MHIVEMVNDILQSIYVYVPQELVIIILALIGYFSFEEYQSSKREKLADK